MTRKHASLMGVSAFVAIAVAVSTCETALASGPDSIRAVHELTNTWNRGDLRSVAAAFASNGTLIAGDGAYWSGRAMIEQYLTSLPQGTRLSLKVNSSESLGDDVVLAKAQGGLLMAGETAVAPERLCVYSVILVRDGKTWRTALAQCTHVPATKSMADCLTPPCAQWDIRRLRTAPTDDRGR